MSGIVDTRIPSDKKNTWGVGDISRTLNLETARVTLWTPYLLTYYLTTYKVTTKSFHGLFVQYELFVEYPTYLKVVGLNQKSIGQKLIVFVSLPELVSLEDVRILLYPLIFRSLYFPRFRSFCIRFKTFLSLQVLLNQQLNRPLLLGTSNSLPLLCELWIETLLLVLLLWLPLISFLDPRLLVTEPSYIVTETTLNISCTYPQKIHALPVSL